MRTLPFTFLRAAKACLLVIACSCAHGQQTGSASKSPEANALVVKHTPAIPDESTPKNGSGVSSVRTAEGSPPNLADNDYRIGEGDVLEISVWKDPEASVHSIVVRPDGKITVPLLKDVQVAGMTTAEAEKVITSGLSTFITDANVTVIVIGINSKKIYIVGAVKKEGPLAYTYRMTIMQALVEAGGLTDYAKRKKIYVLRAQNGLEKKIPFDYDAVLQGKNIEHVWLLPNDTLVVPH